MWIQWHFSIIKFANSILINNNLSSLKQHSVFIVCSFSRYLADCATLYVLQNKFWYTLGAGFSSFTTLIACEATIWLDTAGSKNEHQNIFFLLSQKTKRLSGNKEIYSDLPGAPWHVIFTGDPWNACQQISVPTRIPKPAGDVLKDLFLCSHIKKSMKYNNVIAIYKRSLSEKRIQYLLPRKLL